MVFSTVRFSGVILSVALRACYFLVLRWACRCRWWVLYTQKAKACGATKTHPHPLAETKRCTPMRRKIHGPDATPNLLPCLWPAVAAVLASHPTAPAIAQKCPQASAMGCSEAAARGCPRRRPGGGMVGILSLKFVTRIGLSIFERILSKHCCPTVIWTN